MTFQYGSEANRMIEIVTIAAGAAISGGVELRSRRPRGLAVETPGTWTTADIGLQVSHDNTNWTPVADEFGNRIKISGIATGAAKLYVFPAGAWAILPYPYFRLESLDTADGTAENQAAARTLKVVMLV